MINDQEKRLKFILEQLDKCSDISPKNKEHIHDFICFLSAEGKAKTSRQIKYVIYLKRLARTLKKDFAKADKNDIIQLVNNIEKGKSLWIKRREKPLTEWTKHDFRVTIKRFYKWLREDEGQEFGRGEYPYEVKWIAASMRREKKILPRQVLDEEDLQELLEHTTNNRDRCFIYVLWESGCRVGELVSLRMKDIVDKDQYGTKLTVNGKTGERTVRICDSAPSLDIWMKEHPCRENPNAPIFCGVNGDKRGKLVGDNYFRILLHELAEKANIKKPVNPHHFRHSAASRNAHYLTEAQMNDYFGWQQGSTQAGVYVHSIGKKTDDAILMMHGKKKRDEQETVKEPKTCPRCKTVNDHIANVCQVCGLGLDKKSIMEYDRQKDLTSTLGSLTLEQVKGNPEIEKYIGDLVLRQIQEALKNRGD